MDSLKFLIFFGVIFYVFYLVWIKGLDDRDISRDNTLPDDEMMKETEKDILFRVIGFVAFLIFMVMFIHPNFIK